jgi:hypothetical protein
MHNPRSTPDLTPLGEVLQLALDKDAADIELLLLTRAEHLRRLAAHLACIRWLDVTGHAVKFAELQPALQHYYRMLAERAAKSVDPEVVSLGIEEAVNRSIERTTTAGRAASREIRPDEWCREAIYQFIAVMSEPKVVGQ